MVIDIRYHITTIIAVFLSLGIGILVGSTMIGDDGVIREQQKLIIQIEEDLKILRTQNNEYRAKVSNLETMMKEQDKFINQLFYEAISDKLTGMNGLLIGKDDSKLNYGELQEILEKSGMEISQYQTQDTPSEELEDKWDICLLSAGTIPEGMEEIFSEDDIYNLSQENLTSRQGLYQLVKSLSEYNVEVEGEENDDLSIDPGLQ
mgnify:CR=1 FL=1